MKKILYIFTIIISFLFFDNVLASNKPYIELDYDNLYFQKYLTDNKIEEALEILHEEIIDPYKNQYPYYIIYTSGSNFYIKFLKQDTVYLKTTWQIGFSTKKVVTSASLFSKNSMDLENYNRFDCISYNMPFLYLFDSKNLKDMKDYLTPKLNNQDYSSDVINGLYALSSNAGVTAFDYEHPVDLFEMNGSISTNTNFILESTVDIILNDYDQDNTFDIKVDDTLLLNGSSFKPYHDLVERKYVFRQEVDDVGVNEFVFDLDTSNFNYQDLFEIGYIYESVKGINDTPDLPNNIFEFYGYPYITFLENGILQKRFLNIPDDGVYDRKFKFIGTYKGFIYDGITDVQIHFPANETDNARYYIYFESVVPFNFRKVMNESVVDTYVQVDLTGKYGAFLTPKLTINNSAILSNIYLRGSYSVSYRTSYDISVLPIFQESYNYDIYSLNFGYGESNYYTNLFFENKQYPHENGAYIKYDSKYFDCYIVETKTSSIDVTNPNTGDTTHIDFMDENKPSLSDPDYSTVDGLFKIVSDFLNDLRSSSAYFNKIFYAFYDKLPILFQNFLIVSFVILNVIAILRIGGWKND